MEQKYTAEQLEMLKRHRQYEWDFYKMMIAKCYDKNHHHFSKFGAHGVSVMDEWRYNNDIGFVQFLRDMGKRPSRFHTLETRMLGQDFNPTNLVWMKTKDALNSFSAYNPVSEFAKSKQYQSNTDFIKGGNKKDWFNEFL